MATLPHQISVKYRKKRQAAVQAGFTLIELIAVMVLLGILSAIALPKFFDITPFQERGFFDDTLSAIRYAQKLAVASGCNVQVVIAANQFALNRPGASDRSQCASTTASDFTQSITRPGSGESIYQGSQSGVLVSNATIYFTAKGAASTGLDITVGSRKITVTQNTGFVYDSTP
ncbi:MAG: type II secretion system protein [Methylobacter sp.]|nr:type II secretion system protein [Methylococcales bacterium]MDD5113285.1 type II secretion system protein [Methylobacter sp.]